MKIAIINGPNLNLVGSREPGVYGKEGFDGWLNRARKSFDGMEIRYFQSNVEGELVSHLHACAADCQGIVLNAGAYTHTSVAIADAVAAINVPVVEVHLSNIFQREDFRHVSYLGAKAAGVIAGFCLYSYDLALLYLRNLK
jgi:3-dehydroquinate dehydratase II